jgi:hypothetical protein
MVLYDTMETYGQITLTNLFKSVSAATGGQFFSTILFFVWIFFTGASYFTILKTTGKKRFWHSLTAMSFVCFFLSLLIAAMNEADFVFLNGYWIGFYILMVPVSLFLLDKYK